VTLVGNNTVRSHTFNYVLEVQLPPPLQSLLHLEERKREQLHRNSENHTQNYMVPLPRIQQQSPSWEANSSTASQEIPRILWNQNVHCRVHNSSPSVPVLSQIIPVHAFPLYYLKVHLNIILPSTLRSCELSLYFSLPHQTPVCISFLSHTCHIPRQSHYSWFHHLTNIWWGVTTVSSLLSLSRNSSATSSRTSSTYFLLFMWCGKFHSLKKQLTKLWFLCFNHIFIS